MKNKNKLNSLRVKTWSYFVIFALSILLLLQIFQLVLFEPFYKSTMRSELDSIIESISTIYFSDKDTNDINNDLNSLTQSKDACILVFNIENGSIVGYDAIGENSCAIYNDSTVNNQLIDELLNSEEDELYKEGYLISFSNKEVMVKGIKINRKDNNYLIFANIALQSINFLTKTNKSQLMLITLLLFILSLIMSFIFSSIVSKPIVEIKNEASKLTYGNYDLHFEDFDINEVKDLAETLSVASDEIKKVDEARNELLANVSHDLKTPLTMIKAYAEMIKDISGDNKEKRNEHLNVILSETDTLTKLVSDILNLSRLQSGNYDLKIVPFDLSGVIEETIDKFRTIAEKENVEIEMDCEPELVVEADKDRIGEVLYNFISNALKHYGDDHKIIIKAFNTSNKLIRVEIIDHGSGIDEVNLPYIWDRYFKVDKQYSRSQTGTGLGLSISKAILEAHNAIYGVNSKVNEGSTFYFELNSYKINDL